MGKWAEVHCDCPNRVPLAGSDFYFDKPHRNKRRLTKKERGEVEEWERAAKNMFECGHRSGVVIEFSPGDIVHLGNLLGGIFRDENGMFEVFAKVGDWRCYGDELLLIQPDEAGLWLMEIEEIQRALGGFGNLPQDKIERLLSEFYRDGLGSRLDLERRLDEIAAKMPFAPVVPLKQNVQQSKRPNPESTVEKIMEALTDAAKLCHAGIGTGNPIRLLW
ncbi:MAG: hypothetical protein LC795_20860 [Acidobacteria bacterium]|nr:hypothetical protein [Acidobacteriota bacterium]